MRQSPTRRQVLHGTALVGVATTVGCLSTGQGDDDTDPATNATQTATDTPTATDTAAPTATERPPQSLDEWLAGANGYRGERPRFASGHGPTIAVGQPTDDGLAFDPPVVEVAPMTRVTWDWTGHGGQHNVVALDGTFDSGRTNAQSGTSYHYIFDEPGEYRFVSEPHRDEGMRGAVVVREPPSTGNEAVDKWLVTSDNFDGTFADWTGATTATVRVGAAGNGGHFAFDPPALKVSAGTTIVWEWTGEGGSHNVAFQEVDVGSGSVSPDPGTTFSHTFDEPGTYLYSCEPHHALGERGAVVVE